MMLLIITLLHIDALLSMQKVANPAERLNPDAASQLVRTNIAQFLYDPWRDWEALLSHKKIPLKLEKNEWTFDLIQLPQNRLAITSTNDYGHLQIWDTQNNRLYYKLPKQTHPITCLIPFDDTTIVFGLDDHSLTFWNIEHQYPLVKIRHAHRASIISLLKFSDRYIISASTHEIKAWDISDIIHPRQLPLPGDFAGDGVLNKLDDTHILFKETESNKPTLRITTLNLTDMAHPQKIYSLDCPEEYRHFSSGITIPNSSLIIFSGDNYAQVLLFDSAQQKFIHQLDASPFHSSASRVYLLSPQHLVACFDTGFKIWYLGDPYHPQAIATMQKGSCGQNYVPLSAYSFSCVTTKGPLILYQLDRAALRTYFNLSLKQHAVLSALLKKLRNKSHPITQDRAIELFMNLLPKELNDRIIEEFDIKFEEKPLTLFERAKDYLNSFFIITHF